MFSLIIVFLFFLLMKNSNILERYLARVQMPVRKPDGGFGASVSVVRVFEWVGILLNVVQVTFTFHVHRQIMMKAQKQRISSSRIMFVGVVVLFVLDRPMLCCVLNCEYLCVLSQ